VALGLGALAVGIVFIVVGTRFRSTVAGSALMIVGSAIAAVGVIFVGMEGIGRNG
jgi:hypothetical protein